MFDCTGDFDMTIMDQGKGKKHRNREKRSNVEDQARKQKKKRNRDVREENSIVGFHGSVVEIDSENQDAPIMVSDEVGEDGARVRRLRFFTLDQTSHELVSDHIQTEMALTAEGTPDPTRLMLQYHRVMYDAMCRLPTVVKKVCVLGHGAGALSSFLSTLLRFEICAVDSNPAVLRLGRKHFNDRVTAQHDDGSSFLRRSVGSFDVVLVDLNAPSNEALDAPPREFCTHDFVDLVARVTGNLIMNVLGGSEQARSDVKAAYSRKFSTRWVHPDGCNNYILVATQQTT
ncbi:hypothetical protein GUITHDRAFT_101500 [Guillardia theta CCMP2712]|uniref:PABS domain-containing protein n=1 Tax=Guillardia theta (strain CCMP2712) TaxID=905079 RepID=L1JXW5_GUITC|nr:hypothetical protein GUITHDRAFT_101500 [Guillardia theta CCMP2712]EKX53055.1 hypothetical protein GUITHDRAFT_101500 [Guillardia theta CCMP2712]|eukprot:XP_005840035.1 hypothetical protein GUITHDRAFT_101500 [Guillardia theta CCMP2712]